MPLNNSSNIRKNYSSFWTAFLTQCDKASLPVSPRQIPLNYRRESGHLHMTLSSPIHLKSWPYKAASRNKKIHILIDASEKILLSKMKIVNSMVHVNYFETVSSNPSAARPIESIHYDFDEPPAKAHPLFHAQICRNIIPQDIRNASETFKIYNLSCDIIERRYQHLKIPTAHMNLLSVLISLFADHAPQDQKPNDYLKNIITYTQDLDKIPKAPFSSLLSNIKKHNSFKGIHWYTI